MYTYLYLFYTIVKFKTNLGLASHTQVCACPKLGPGFLTSYVAVFFMFNELSWEAIVRFVDIVRIDDNHHLNFLFIIKKGTSLVENVWCRVRVMVFNANFSNVSVISWRSVILMDHVWYKLDFNLPMQLLPFTSNKNRDIYIYIYIVEWSFKSLMTMLQHIATRQS